MPLNASSTFESLSAGIQFGAGGPAGREEVLIGERQHRRHMDSPAVSVQRKVAISTGIGRWP